MGITMGLLITISLWGTGIAVAVLVGIELGKIARNLFDRAISRWCGNDEEEDL